MIARDGATSSGAVPRSLAERAYRLLVTKITRLELAPGNALVEKELVELLAIGRTPIREALQRLSVEGLVVHLPNRGMFVSEVNPTSAQHIYEFRALIDGQAARLAALRAKKADLRALHRIHQRLAAAIEADEIDRFVEQDRQFYSALAGAAQNIHLAEAMQRIFNLHLRLWFLISKQIGGWHEIARAHARMTLEMTEAIERREPDEAEVALKGYVHGRLRQIRDVYFPLDLLATGTE